MEVTCSVETGQGEREWLRVDRGAGEGAKLRRERERHERWVPQLCQDLHGLPADRAQKGIHRLLLNLSLGGEHRASERQLWLTPRLRQQVMQALDLGTLSQWTGRRASYRLDQSQALSSRPLNPWRPDLYVPRGKLSKGRPHGTLSVADS